MNVAKLLNPLPSATVHGGLVRLDPPSDRPVVEFREQNYNSGIHRQTPTEVGQETVELSRPAQEEPVGATSPACSPADECSSVKENLLSIADVARSPNAANLSAANSPGTNSPPYSGGLVLAPLEHSDDENEPPQFTNPWLPGAVRGPQDRPGEICPLYIPEAEQSASSMRRGRPSERNVRPRSSAAALLYTPPGRLDAGPSHSHDNGFSAPAKRAESRYPAGKTSPRKRRIESREAVEVPPNACQSKRAKPEPPTEEDGKDAMDGCLRGQDNDNRMPAAPQGSPRASNDSQLQQTLAPVPSLPHRQDTPLISELRKNLNSLLAQAA